MIINEIEISSVNDESDCGYGYGYDYDCENIVVTLKIFLGVNL